MQRAWSARRMMIVAIVVSPHAASKMAAPVGYARFVAQLLHVRNLDSYFLILVCSFEPQCQVPWDDTEDCMVECLSKEMDPELVCYLREEWAVPPSQPMRQSFERLLCIE